MNARSALAAPLTAPRSSRPALTSRRVVHLSAGRTHGPITRLASPSDLGQLIKPFVFLDLGELPSSGGTFFGMHPHSGIATLTVVLDGALAYEDTTGQSGVVPAGGLEWMKAGAGVWHDGRVASTSPMAFFQLWVALPEAEENAPAESQYIEPAQVQSEGPARVVLGRLGNATSLIRAPAGMNYLHVQLKAGERWTYPTPTDHTVAWVAVNEGLLLSPDPIAAGQIAVFAESNAPIEFEALWDTSFVLGSAVKHPHELVTGYYSVHTNAAALARGEAEIQRIGQQLRASGRIR